MSTTQWILNLKILRSKKGLSQAQLGIQLNKGQRVIANWENGNSEPSTKDWLKISQFYSIPLDDLLNKSLNDVNLNLEGKKGKDVNLNVNPNVNLTPQNGSIEPQSGLINQLLMAKDEVIRQKEETIKSQQVTIDVLSSQNQSLKDDLDQLKRELQEAQSAQRRDSGSRHKGAA